MTMAHFGMRKGVMALVAALVLSAGGLAFAAKDKAAKGKDAKAKDDPVARGAYLVHIGGCNDCHTPWVFNKDLGMPAPDMTRMLSGHPAGTPDSATKLNPKTDIAVIGSTFTSFTLPFGVVYAANLTPDKETGMGNWTEEMFTKSMRTGMHMGEAGRPIMPPMPWPAVRAMTDDDLKAVYAFLKTIPPVNNPVSDPKVPKPVMDGMLKARPKLIEMLDAPKGPPPGAAPAGAPAAAPAAPAGAPAPAKK
jgi:hypothetical protein